MQKKNNISNSAAKKIFAERNRNNFKTPAESKGYDWGTYERSLWVTKKMGAEARQIILSNPISYTIIHGLSLLPLFTDGGWREILRSFDIKLGQPKSLTLLISQGKILIAWQNIWQNPTYALLLILEKSIFTIIFLLALGGIYILYKKDKWLAIWLVIIIGYFSIAPSVVASSRFRYPIEPLMFVLVAIWLENKLQKPKLHKI